MSGLGFHSEKHASCDNCFALSSASAPKNTFNNTVGAMNDKTTPRKVSEMAAQVSIPAKRNHKVIGYRMETDVGDFGVRGVSCAALWTRLKKRRNVPDAGGWRGKWHS